VIFLIDAERNRTKLATYKISLAFAGIWPGKPLMEVMSADKVYQFSKFYDLCPPERHCELM
jgi:hypothetical protein